MTRYCDDGERIRGDKEIYSTEAENVRRIFEGYARGSICFVPQSTHWLHLTAAGPVPTALDGESVPGPVQHPARDTSKLSCRRQINLVTTRVCLKVLIPDLKPSAPASGRYFIVRRQRRAGMRVQVLGAPQKGTFRHRAGRLDGLADCAVRLFELHLRDAFAGL